MQNVTNIRVIPCIKEADITRRTPQSPPPFSYFHPSIPQKTPCTVYKSIPTTTASVLSALTTNASWSFLWPDVFSIVGMVIGLVRVEFGSAVFCADTVTTFVDVAMGILIFDWMHLL